MKRILQWAVMAVCGLMVMAMLFLIGAGLEWAIGRWAWKSLGGSP